jgi:DNA-binding GntR family transcriptional regulator
MQQILAVARDEGCFLTELEVCRATHRSRTPVREALLRLEADGLVQIVPKKGAYVSPITESDVDSVMQARSLIEDWCIRRVAQSSDPPLPELDKLLYEQAKLRRNPIAFVQSDRDFHRTIIRSAGNAVLAHFYDRLRDRQSRMGVHAISASAERTNNVIAEHKAIVEALRLNDADRSAAAMATHMSNTLVVLRRLS